jgi:hypothetical protein
MPDAVDPVLYPDHDFKRKAAESLYLPPREGTMWRHWKGVVYEVVARSIYEETGTQLVTYRSPSTGWKFTRTVTNFLENVPPEDLSRFGFDPATPTPRFTPVDGPSQKPTTG